MSCIHLYDGGARAGIFGTGVADSLAAANAKKPDAIVASSAGIVPQMTLATNPAGDRLKMFEDFVTHNTLQVSKAIRTFLKKALYEWTTIGPKPSDMTADVPKVMRIMEDHGMSPDGFRKSNVDCYARVLDVRDRTAKAIKLNTAEDPKKVVEDMLLCEPHYFRAGARHHIDALLEGTRGYQQTAEIFPDARIIGVNNAPQNSKRYHLPRIQAMVEGMLSLDFDVLLAHMRSHGKVVEEDRFIQRHGDQIITVQPPDDYPVEPQTNSIAPIQKGYHMGRKAGDALLTTLEKEGLN